MWSGRIIFASVIVLLSGTRCEAQWYAGWYGGWSGEGSTPYSSAVRAQATFVAAAGQATESYARAALTAERARSQYLDNQAKYLEWRQQQRAISEERQMARLAALRTKVANRPTPPRPIDLYPPLGADQLDRVTGEIQWPPCLLDPQYEMERSLIEAALRSRAESGPDERTDVILHDTAWRMLSKRPPTMRGLDSQTHLACCRFMKSLMLEGEFSAEVLR